MREAFETVIGLEVHVELNTKTKAFCGCSTTYGAEPNTQCCPVCVGLPGALPALNRQAVAHAVKAGLAMGCEIASYSKMDRKNYFYPDLPKSYQISQQNQPLCQSGYILIESADGSSQRIGITRIHLEEDAGKLLHTAEASTLIDYNRCGIPLIEIVSEPDLRSAAQVKAFLQKLRTILLYIEVSDCKMNEGGLRCDINLSVRRKGDIQMGTRTEMKNLNSFQSVVRAIEYESARQIDVLSSGGAVKQETRRFDQQTGKTYAMRLKESEDDYHFFPDPDLLPFEITDAMIRELTEQIPVLPDERKRLYTERFGLTAYCAGQLADTRETAAYFESAAAITRHPQIAANLMLTEFPRLLTADSPVIGIAPAHFAALADLLGEGRINSSTGKSVLDALWEHDQDPAVYVETHGLALIRDEKLLTDIALQALAENANAVEDYKKGKKSAMQSLIGQMMKKTRGKADPAKAQVILTRLLTEDKYRSVTYH